MVSALKFTLFLTTFAAIGLFATSLILQDNRFLLAATGHLGLALLLFFPVMSRRKIGAFDPLGLFVLYVVLGTIGNAYVIAFSDSRRRGHLVNGEPIELFIWGGLWLALALMCVGLGYVLCQNRLRVERILPNDRKFTSGGLHLAALIALVLALIATVIFIQQTGGISGLANLSRKRAIEVVSGDDVVFASGGYTRLVAALPLIFISIMLTHYLKAEKKLRPWQFAFLFVILMGGLIFPFLSSSRASILYSFIGLIFVYGVYRRISVGLVVTSLVIGLSVFSVMTALRLYANLSIGGVEAAQLEVPNPIVALAESGNGMSLSGTTHILDGVPERMDYKYGTTFVSWVVAPIPRTIWPGKPQISLGKEVKSVIMGQPAVKAGRPASFIAEGFINFGWIGFFAVAGLFGYMLRLTTNTFEPVMKDNVFTATIYFALYLNVPALANGTISQGMVRTLSDILPIYFIFVAAMVLSLRPVMKTRIRQRGRRLVPTRG